MFQPLHQPTGRQLLNRSVLTHAAAVHAVCADYVNDFSRLDNLAMARQVAMYISGHRHDCMSEVQQSRQLAKKF